MNETGITIREAVAGARRLVKDPVRVEPVVRLSLSGRLLLLTIAFVMLIEVLIFAPSVARFRVDFIQDKLSEAHLILTALDQSHATIDPALRDAFLDDAEMYEMSLARPGRPVLSLIAGEPLAPDYEEDLRTLTLWDEIVSAFDVLIRGGDSIFRATDTSRMDEKAVVSAVIDEASLNDDLRAYAIRLFILSLFSSIATAVLVYTCLTWLAVRPLRRLTESMIAFRDAPEDPTRVIVPTTRADEVGIAERALADLQHQLRISLSQRERLAAVGTAVTKVSHDLKNLIATAILESDRLAAVGGEETRRITAGIVRALERAVALSKSTLRFAQEGLPVVHARAQALAPAVQAVAAELRTVFKGCEILVDVDPAYTLTFDPDLFHRALENLVRNAVEGGATKVSIKLATGRRAKLIVSDNGRGLPPRAVANLFVPFAGSARVGGSGLGLPIARESLRVQGGELVLAKTGPQGTEFVIRLPG